MLSHQNENKSCNRVFIFRDRMAGKNDQHDPDDMDIDTHDTGESSLQDMHQDNNNTIDPDNTEESSFQDTHEDDNNTSE